MGVSGAGKSAVGFALARRLGLEFVDADALHPETNVAKMAAGIPLTDDDRWPWLALVGHALASAEREGLVIACSALRRAYRDAIRAVAPTVQFVHLSVPASTLAQRVGDRPEHFMPAALLDSQLATLEPLEADEVGVSIDSVGGVEATADAAVEMLSPQK